MVHYQGANDMEVSMFILPQGSCLIYRRKLVLLPYLWLVEHLGAVGGCRKYTNP